MDRTEIERVAASLTDEQRKAVLRLSPNGDWATDYTDPPWPRFHMRYELGELGEMRPNAVFNHGFRLTTLGLEVRKYLEAQ